VDSTKEDADEQKRERELGGRCSKKKCYSTNPQYKRKNNLYKYFGGTKENTKDYIYRKWRNYGTLDKKYG